MGDISEMRGLITAIAFLSSLVLFMMWIPPELYILSASQQRQAYAPDIFEMPDIYTYADYNTFQFNESGGGDWIINPDFYRISILDGNGEWLGGHDVDLIYKKANETGLSLFMIHYFNEWMIFPSAAYMTWYDQNGIRQDNGQWLTVEDIEANSADNTTSRWRAIGSGGEFTYHTHFGYNGTLYNNFTHAWNFHALYMFVGIDFDDVATGYNAFQLVAMILFFQLPDLDIYIKALLAAPFYACIAYLAYIFTLRAIGAIFGGGGA